MKNNTKEQTSALNTWRISLKNEGFTKEEFTKVLKSCNIPVPNMCVRLFMKELLVRVSKNKYTFKTNNPIHYTTVGNLIAQYRNKRKQADQNKKEIKSDIEKAIDLLKSNGYKIYKQTINYEEV